MSENNDFVFCLLVNRMIEDIDCIENRDVVDGLIKDTTMPQEYKIENFREICKNCKRHDY